MQNGYDLETCMLWSTSTVLIVFLERESSISNSHKASVWTLLYLSLPFPSYECLLNVCSVYPFIIVLIHVPTVHIIQFNLTEWLNWRLLSIHIHPKHTLASVFFWDNYILLPFFLKKIFPSSFSQGETKLRRKRASEYVSVFS